MNPLFATDLIFRIVSLFLILVLLLCLPRIVTGQGKQPGESTSDSSKKSILKIELFDGESIKGQLFLPKNTNQVKSLVIFVHGTGPGTYLNKRKSGKRIFNYFDYFGEALASKSVAFFSYNKRGVTIGDKPPMYDEVNREKFRKVVSSIESKDLASIVDELKKSEALKNANVLLLGGSEGTVVAAMVAEQFPEKVDGLLLFGYAHENMYDIIAWQYSGAASMIRLNPIFDSNDDGKISKSEYESDEAEIAKQRKSLMQNVGFQVLDVNKDEVLTKDDFAIRTRLLHNMLLYKLEQNDEDWIWDNYFRISIPWLKEHFVLEPNKTRLPKLDLPIYIFHGTNDAHVPVSSLKDLEQRFKSLSKDNLKTFEFKDHDHNLNFDHWLSHDEPSPGLAKIIKIASEFSEN